MGVNYDNNLSGALFRNDKDGVENRPDYRGSEIDRIQYWVSAWIRTSKKGDKFMSLRFEPKKASEAKGGVKNPAPAAAGKDDFDDEIPF
jgi:uncharacterized protein (DUF736 family)